MCGQGAAFSTINAQMHARRVLFLSVRDQASTMVETGIAHNLAISTRLRAFLEMPCMRVVSGANLGWQRESSKRSDSGE
jgi:hypothetical protein